MLENTLDRAQYAVACDDEANEHYGVAPSRRWSALVWLKGFWDRLTTPRP